MLQFAAKLIRTDTQPPGIRRKSVNEVALRWSFIPRDDAACGIAAQTTAVTLLLRHSEYRSLSEGSEEAVHDEWNKHSVGVSKWGTKTTAPSTEEEGTEWR